MDSGDVLLDSLFYFFLFDLFVACEGFNYYKTNVLMLIANKLLNYTKHINKLIAWSFLKHF